MGRQALWGAVVVCAGLVACGGSASHAAHDAGAVDGAPGRDATSPTDATNDGTLPPDAGADTTTAPDSSQADTSIDASPPGDAPAETSPPPADAPISVTITAEVSGLEPGDSLVLENDGVGPVTVTANGPVVVATVASGSSYAVMVSEQPGSPAETCTIASPSGTASTDITLLVTCSPDDAGVDSAAPPQDAGDGGDGGGSTQEGGPSDSGAPVDSAAGPESGSPNDASAPESGSADTGIADGGAGDVITSDTGAGSDGGVAYTIGGTLAGLASGDSVELADNGADTIFLGHSGAFTFPTALPPGAAYAVTVVGNPRTPVPQSCTVTDGSGVVGSANITNVSVSCTVVIETIVANGPSRNWSDGTYATACYQYLNPPAGYSYAGLTGSGRYTIQPTPATTPFDVYCDMVTDSGGWTLVDNDADTTSAFTTRLAGANPDPTVTRGSYLPAYTWSSNPQLLCKASVVTGNIGWVTLDALTAVALEYPTQTTQAGPSNGNWSYDILNGNTPQGTEAWIYVGAGRFGSVWIGNGGEPTCACDYYAPSPETGLGTYVSGNTPTCSTWVR